MTLLSKHAINEGVKIKEYLVLTQTTISQIVPQWTFGTRQSPMQLFHLMLVCWMMLLSIQIVITEVLGVLYLGTLQSIQPQWLITQEPLLGPELVLSVILTVGMG